MNSLAPISITGTPGVLWKWGTILSAMAVLARLGAAQAPPNLRPMRKAASPRKRPEP
jgi:hypothetical protein